jgi:uncharacterized protein (UPF0335 family)
MSFFSGSSPRLPGLGHDALVHTTHFSTRYSIVASRLRDRCPCSAGRASICSALRGRPSAADSERTWILDGEAAAMAGKDKGKGTIQAERLKSFIERIERLEEERAALTGDIREVYAEAKSAGYDTKVMRQIVRLRKMDAADRQEQQALLDVYIQAVGL